MKNFLIFSGAANLILVIALIILWSLNFYKLINCDFQSPYKCEIIHGIGIAPPISLLTGWLDVGK